MTSSKIFNQALVALAMAMAVANGEEDGGIINGSEVPTDSYKFLTSLQTTSGRHFCGGSVVAPDYVLTAAHCVTGGAPSSFRIRYGTTDLNSSRGTVVSPSKVTVHPNYDSNNIRNDIALIKLSSSISNVSPINMDKSSDTLQSGTATVAGWGLTTGGGSSTPSRMREVDIPIVDDATCKQNSLYNTYLRPEMICTGYNNGFKGSCNGDSGGPLFQGSNQIGLVSWGTQGCTSYSVFTQVNSYKSWIESTMGDDNGGGGGDDQCECIGTGLDVGSTCGNWLNAGFNWCYSDKACPGSTPSQRYDGYHWFECNVSKLGQALEIEAQAVFTPAVPLTAAESFESPAANAQSTTEPASEMGMVTGLAIGVAAAGVASAGAFLVYRNKKNAEVTDAIERAEEERRVVSSKMEPVL